MRPSLTTLCRGCAARSPEGTKACPRCGSRELLDLTKPAARRAVAAALLPPAGGSALSRGLRGLERSMTSLAKVVPWIVVPVAFTFVATTHGSWRVALLAAGTVALISIFASGATLLVVSTGNVLTGIVGGVARWVRRGKPVRRHAWPLPPPKPSGETQRERVRGRVYTDNVMRSPVAHTACVGWRLVGTTEGSEIDDANFVPFDVVSDDGQIVHVPDGALTLAIEPDLDPRVVPPDEALTAFLDERAALVAQGPVRLAEALLKVGDEVIVEGVAERRTVQVGYREAREGRVLVELPGAPRVVRRA